MTDAEKGKALYGPYMSDEELAFVNALDEGDQAYFWAILYYQVTTDLEKDWLKKMEERVIRGDGSRPTGLPSKPEPLPFKAAEESVSTHGWFRRVF